MKRKISKKDIATLPKLYLLSKKDMFVNVTFQVFWFLIRQNIHDYLKDLIFGPL